MRLVGFNFSKINIEKVSNNLKDLKINTNINISEIDQVKNNFLKGKEEIIAVKFIYTLDYEPNIAKVEFNGNILLEIESKAAKELLKQWKDKKISEDLRITLFNIILRKSNIKALQLEDEINLPLHINLPLIKKEDKEKK